VESQDDESELLYTWRGGDRRAGDELLRRYYRQVLGFFRLRMPDVAEDLTQRTFLTCMEAKSQVGSSFRGYLFGAARNVLYKHLRAAGRQARRDSVVVPQAQSTLTPSTMVALRQEHWLLLRALQQLSRTQQEMVALHYVQCLRAREIAEAMDLSVSTVTTRLARARDALRHQVETLSAPAKIRESLAADLETWTRSLGPIVEGPEVDGSTFTPDG
jgi:RNA polymerase sigma factor (sigma-70 family)